MEILVVFDSLIKDVDPLAGHADADTLELFPLTDDWRVIQSVKTNFERLGKNVTLLNTAALVDHEVELLGKKLIPWSAALGERLLAGRSLIEWFLIPREKASTWWFSLLSEKNPLKTDTFLRLAQTHALASKIRSKRYGACYVVLSRPNLTQAVVAECQRASIPVKSSRGRLALQAGPVESLLRGILWLMRFVIKGFKARRAMGSLSNRTPKPDSVLFVSYFPALDREQAKKGIFKNRYGLPLQNFLAEKGKAINWLFMSVPYEDLNYDDALSYGKNFLAHGESVTFVEEFLSWKDMAQSLFIWFRQIVICLYLSVKMPRGLLAENLTTPEGEVFLKKLWYDSFIGYTGIGGIVFLKAYKKALDHFAHTTTCLYYLEMQAWEKALNAARRDHPNLKTIGFQHSAFSQNHFSYYYAPSEIQQKGTALDLPLPSVLGCNGEAPYKVLTEQGYSHVRRLEAVRHFYLQRALASDRPQKPSPHVILWVGAYDKKEAMSSFLLLCQAFPNPEGFEVWLKPHPGLSLNIILAELGIDPHALKYRIQKNVMNELLPAVTSVIVGESSVAIDALGFGCHVIVPVLTNALFMNPLGRYDQFYKKVYGPDELAQAVQETLQNEICENDFQEMRRFVASYWNLDESLQGWSQVLFNHV